MDEQQQLPTFEGNQPRLTEIALTGKSNRRTRGYRLHERITLVLECEVVGVEHKETKGGLLRVHKVAVTDAYELGGDRAPDLVAELAAEYEELFGDPTLPFGDGDEPQVGEVREIDGVDHEWAELPSDPESDEDDEPTFGWVECEPLDADGTTSEDAADEATADGADT